MNFLSNMAKYLLTYFDNRDELWDYSEDPAWFDEYVDTESVFSMSESKGEVISLAAFKKKSGNADKPTAKEKSFSFNEVMANNTQNEERMARQRKSHNQKMVRQNHLKIKKKKK